MRLAQPPQGRVGVIVCGGMNPVAAVVENAIPTRNLAMRTLCEFSELCQREKKWS